MSMLWHKKISHPDYKWRKEIDMAKNVSSLIRPGFVFTTSPKAKYIGVGRLEDKSPSRYIPKTKENLRAIMGICGKPDVYDDKRKPGGKLFIWW